MILSQSFLEFQEGKAGSIRNNCRNKCSQKRNSSNVLQMLWKTIPHLFSLTFFNISNFSKKHPVYPGMTKDFKYYSHNPALFTLKTALGILHNFHLFLYAICRWLCLLLSIYVRYLTTEQLMVHIKIVYLSYHSKGKEEMFVLDTKTFVRLLKSAVLCQEEAVC